MPYIRYKGRMYNVTTSSYIDSFPALYTFDRYTGTQFSDVTGLDNRNDIIWNGCVEGEASLNVGYKIEYEAKKYYYNSDLTEWPVLRILTTADVNDYYIEWTHDNPMALTVKANGILQSSLIPFIWNDDIELVDGVPRFNTCRARVFTTSRDKEELQIIPQYYGSFAPNDITGAWFTRVNVEFTVISSPAMRYNQNDMLADFTGNNYVFTYYKSNNGAGIYFVDKLGTTGAYSVFGIAPVDNNNNFLIGYDALYNYPSDPPTVRRFFYWNNIRWGVTYGRGLSSGSYVWNPSTIDTELPILDIRYVDRDDLITLCMVPYVTTTTSNLVIYEYLNGEFIPLEPPSDVDPEDIPPIDEEPEPIPPDSQDPYYDPESDPTSPSYDPTKDPTSPSYDPTTPSTPYKPPSQPTILEMPVIQPTPTVIPTPETPPSYVTTNDLFTLFNPSGGDLTSIANFLWSPTWSVETLKKIFANPLDCILGLLVLPHLQAPVSTKTMNIGNISTGITLHYFTSQFFDFDCGAFALPEYYQSYLDYAPYTKISIFLPYIGDQELNTDEVMGKNIGVKYRFDLATGDCIAFISIDGDVLYSFAGNCAARLPLSANNYAGIIPSITSAAIRASTIPSDVSALGAATALAVTAMKQSASHTGSISGSAGLMGIQTPYLIVTRPRQALPLSQNSFKGYPSFITESLSQLSGYTEVDQVHLEHVPATGAELVEIERLLKEGVLF